MVVEVLSRLELHLPPVEPAYTHALIGSLPYPFLLDSWDHLSNKRLALKSSSQDLPLRDPNLRWFA